MGEHDAGCLRQLRVEFLVDDRDELVTVFCERGRDEIARACRSIEHD